MAHSETYLSYSDTQPAAARHPFWHGVGAAMMTMTGTAFVVWLRRRRR